MICDACGFDMTEEEDSAVETMIAVVVDYDNIDHPMIQRVKETFGKTKFAVCHVCWLKSLGVKPLEQK